METMTIAYQGRPKRDRSFPDYAPHIETRKYSVMEVDHLYIFVQDPQNPRMRKKPRDVKFIGLMMAVTEPGEYDPAAKDYKMLPPFTTAYIKLDCTKYPHKRVFLKAFYIDEDDNDGKVSRPYSFLIR